MDKCQEERLNYHLNLPIEPIPFDSAESDFAEAFRLIRMAAMDRIMQGLAIPEPFLDEDL